MKNLSVLLTFLLCLPVYAGTFTEHVGTHYGESWSATVRTPSDVSDVINTSISYADNLTSFAATTGNLAKYSTAILQVFGGREYTNVAAFLDAVKADQGAGLRAHLAAKAALTKGMKNVYWQIGNEINNGPKLSPSIHQWLGDGLAGGSNDLTILPTYVEMWLAPSVAGLLEGDPSAQIVIGSVANAAGATAFIDALLDYQIAGTYAPTLAGKFVREIAKTGSIHYSMGSETWQTPIDQYTSRGLAVWSTEEVGAGPAEKDLCMTAFTKAVGRMFSYNPKGKVFAWGAGLGTNTCDQWMPTLTGFIGANALKPVSAGKISGLNIEAYLYAVGTTGKRVAFIIAPLGGTLTSVSGTGTIYVFRDTGVETYPASQSLSIPLDGNSAAYVALDPRVR